GAPVVRLPRLDATGAGGHLARIAGRRGGCDRRRERGRQEHAGEAARQAVRADEREDLRRRATAGEDADREVARAPGRGVPGLLSVGAAGWPERGGGRPAAAGRRAGGGRGPGAGRGGGGGGGSAR